MLKVQADTGNSKTIVSTAQTESFLFLIDLASYGQVLVDIFNLLGVRVASLVNNYLEPGDYTIRFNAQELPSGIYFYRLKSAAFEKINKMILSK